MQFKDTFFIYFNENILFFQIFKSIYLLIFTKSVLQIDNSLNQSEKMFS